MSVSGDIKVRHSDQLPHGLGLAAPRKHETGGMIHVVLEQPQKLFPSSVDSRPVIILRSMYFTYNRSEYTSKREPGRRTCGHREGNSQDPHDRRGA